jgi:stage II sporulation protein M
MHLLRRNMRTAEDYLRRHAGTVLLIGCLFVIGVVFGALAVRSLSPRDRAEQASYLSETIGRAVKPSQGEGGLLLKASLLRSGKYLALLWICGISLVGMVVVMGGALVLGYVTGFTVSFLVAEMGGAGLALAIAGHLPQNLLQVPALVVAGTAAVAFSLQVVRSWRERRRVPNFYPALARFTGTLLAAGLVLVLAALVESYLSPALVRLASGWLHL